MESNAERPAPLNGLVNDSERVPLQEGEPLEAGNKPVIVLVASLLPGLMGVFGVGHFLIGKRAKGLALLLSGLTLVFLTLGGILLPMIWFGLDDLVFVAVMLPYALVGLWLWQAYDAYTIAKQLQGQNNQR